MKTTLVKSKIVLEADGTSLVIYLWKPTFLCFGYWYPFECTCGSPIQKEKLIKINDDSISDVLFENFLSN